MKILYCVSLQVASIFIFMATCFPEKTERNSCLEFTTPSESGKLCRSKAYTFTCHANSTYLIWKFHDHKHTLFWNNSRWPTMLSNCTDHKCEYFYTLYSSERRSYGNYMLKSSLTVYPLDDSFQFNVSCITRCGQNRIESLRNTYQLAEIPKMPRSLDLESISNHTNCSVRPSAKFNWTHPENFERTLFSHYDTNLINCVYAILEPRYITKSYTYVDLAHSTEYRFEVYVVDKCGQKGEIANKTIKTPERQVGTNGQD